MAENAFLTERRREFLDGDYNLNLSKDRHLKHSLKESTEMALKELIEVAASPEIENSEVFEPNDLARLVDALMVPNGTTLTPRWNFDGDPAEYRDTYRYQLALHGRLDHALDGYGEMLHRDYGPDETPTFGDVMDE
jgi:hypothetical protein